MGRLDARSLAIWGLVVVAVLLGIWAGAALYATWSAPPAALG